MSSVLKQQFYQAEDYFFRSLSLKTLDISEGITAYMTKVPSKDFNFLYVNNTIPDLEQAFQVGEEFFQSENLSFVVVISEELGKSSAQEILRSRKYVFLEQTTAMGLNLDTFSQVSLRVPITIKSGPERLKDWMVPQIEAFKSTFQATSDYMLLHELAITKGKKLYHYSGYHEEQPISSTTLSIQDTLARIDDVSTLHAFRSKGYATSLVNHALAHARKLGSTHCFLESSPSARALYEKLGFQSLFRNQVYTKQE